MQDEISGNLETDTTFCAKQMAQSAGVLLDGGLSVGAVVGGTFQALLTTLRIHGHSDLEISNLLVPMIAELRESHEKQSQPKH